MGIALDGRIRRLVLPCVLFIALLSGLGHKEWRFIVYTIPVLNMAAAQGACRLIRQSRQQAWQILTVMLVTGVIVLNIFATTAITVASALNYPGGQALASLQPSSRAVHTNSTVFIDDLAAQTGASLFLQTSSPPFVSCDHEALAHSAKPWAYHKILSESTVYSHAIVEDASDYIPPSVVQSIDSERIPFAFSTRLVQPVLKTEMGGDWTPVAFVRGLDGWGFDKSAKFWLARYVPVPFVTRKLWILQRG